MCAGAGRQNGERVVVETSDSWHATAFPSYLQSEVDDFCKEWDEALQACPSLVASKLGQDLSWPLKKG